MFHTRIHLNLIFCAGALMTLHPADAQNASPKIRFTNGLHGGVDIARSSMAMTDKHPLGTYLYEIANVNPRGTIKSLFVRINQLFSEHGVENTIQTEVDYLLYLQFLQHLDNPEGLEKIYKEFPFLKSLTLEEKLELSHIDTIFFTTLHLLFTIPNPIWFQNFDWDESQGSQVPTLIQILDSSIDKTERLLSKAIVRHESQAEDPKNVNCLGLQTRFYGDDVVHSIDYLYGNRHPSFDLGFQGFWGSNTGVGVGLRFPLFRLNGLNDADPELHLENVNTDKNLKSELDEIEKKIKYEQDRYITNIQHPALAFVGGARTIDRVGQTYNAGVNFSILKELHKNGAAVEFLASTQYFWFHSGLQDAQGVRVPSSEAARFGLGFAINDRMVAFKEDTDNKSKKKYYDLKYWRWQAGAEYSFKNRLTEGDTVTGYLRNRDNGGNEYTLYGGVASQQGFFGIAFAKKFK